MTRATLSAVFASLVALCLAPTAARAHDELYYSAAACVPISATQWNGNGAHGFQFTNVGTWNNYDDDHAQILVCPVPYARDANDLAPIVARVVIDDRNQAALARAFLCGRGISGNQNCASKDNFPTILGTSTLELTLTPSTATRFVWLEIHIPPNDEVNDPFSVRGTSGLVGYRIFRN
ncbi:MAG TPA: hypothetical protein VMV21_11085 [Vicinamibacteria bacterium]|nr:hypothetical protein [Vicinamibacteria bacterium]